MKINALYVYDEDQNCMFTYSNLGKERQVFQMGTPNESARYFAINAVKKIRLPIRKKSGKVYHDWDSHRYILWLENPSKKAALMIFEEDILERLVDEIAETKIHLKDLIKQANKIKNDFAQMR